MKRKDESLAEYESRNNVNYVKRSRTMGRPKVEETGWIIDEKEKGKVTTGEWVKMKKKQETSSEVMHSCHFNLPLYSAKVANVANSYSFCSTYHYKVQSYSYSYIHVNMLDHFHPVIIY